MELARAMLEQIVGTGDVQTGGFPRERRKHPRLPFSGRGKLVRLDGGESERTLFVKFRDISVAGVGFLSAIGFAVGERIALAIPRRSADGVLCRCVVVRCQPIEAGLCVVGATFEELVSPQGSAAGAGAAGVVQQDAPAVPSAKEIAADGAD